MPLDLQISGLPMFDTFLAHLSNSDNRDKFCVAVVLWTPLFEMHTSLLLADMFTHRPGVTVRWRMYDPNFPFDYTCHDAAYTQAYAALLQKVQHGLQQAVAASPYKAHVAQIACNSCGAGPIATQGDLQRSCLRMSHTKGMCMLICLSVLTQLVENAVIWNVSDDKYVRAFGNFSVIDNCICSYMRELSKTCLRTFQSNCYRALVTTLMRLELLTNPDVRLYMLSDDDDRSIFNRRLTNRANGGFDFDDIAEFHILWAKHRDCYENANAVSMRYEAYAAYRADFDLQVSKGRRPIMAKVVYHMPTIMQPSTEMWPEDGKIPMEEEENSDLVNISPHSPTEKRLHWLGFWMPSGLGFALLCSAVPPGAATHVTEHHPSRGQMWQDRMALWVSGVPLCGAPDACAYQPRRVQSVGDLVVCRHSRSKRAPHTPVW